MTTANAAAAANLRRKAARAASHMSDDWIDAIDDAPRCECGEWSHEPCQGELGDDAVTIEYMPDWLRASCDAARNRGIYPHNGAVRIRVTPECAEMILEADGEWASEIH